MGTEVKAAVVEAGLMEVDGRGVDDAGIFRGVVGPSKGDRYLSGSESNLNV